MPSFSKDNDDNNNNKVNNNTTMKSQQQEDIITDPLKLSGLGQATYIMKGISESEPLEKIIKKFEEDEQLVKLWMSFLLRNKCIQKPTGDHRWLVTDNGIQWIEKYQGDAS
jgi:hypothetical protein